MKIKRSSFSPPVRRTSPITFLLAGGGVLLIALLAWFWMRGGPEPQTRVEKAIPAERLGH